MVSLNELYCVSFEVLAALLPMCCLPYARTVLRGATRDWVLGLLLAWGKARYASTVLDSSFVSLCFFFCSLAFSPSQVAASSLELQLP